MVRSGEMVVCDLHAAYGTKWQVVPVPVAARFGDFGGGITRGEPEQPPRPLVGHDPVTGRGEESGAAFHAEADLGDEGSVRVLAAPAIVVTTPPEVLAAPVAVLGTPVPAPVRRSVGRVTIRDVVSMMPRTGRKFATVLLEGEEATVEPLLMAMDFRRHNRLQINATHLLFTRSHLRPTVVLACGGSGARRDGCSIVQFHGDAWQAIKEALGLGFVEYFPVDVGKECAAILSKVVDSLAGIHSPTRWRRAVNRCLEACAHYVQEELPHDCVPGEHRLMPAGAFGELARRLLDQRLAERVGAHEVRLPVFVVPCRKSDLSDVRERIFTAIVAVRARVTNDLAAPGCDEIAAG